MNKKLKDVIFILLLGSVSILALLGIKSYTYPRIVRYEELMFKSTILEAAEVPYTPESLEEAFGQNIRKVTKGEFTYYLSSRDSSIFEFEGRGLWGLIRGVITLRPDLETLESVRIISQEETPGLGARITEEQFLDQFKNKKIDGGLKIVLRRKATADNEVDAISGASMTSAALVGIINEAIEHFRSAQ